jgi:hypothetical protein
MPMPESGGLRRGSTAAWLGVVNFPSRYSAKARSAAKLHHTNIGVDGTVYAINNAMLFAVT